MTSEKAIAQCLFQIVC